MCSMILTWLQIGSPEQLNCVQMEILKFPLNNKQKIFEMRYYFTALCMFFLFSCTNDNQKVEEKVTESKEVKDEFYHYSIWTALVNKIYDANLTVKEAKAHGD